MLQNIRAGALFMALYFTVSATSWIVVQFTEKNIDNSHRGCVSLTTEWYLVLLYGYG